jgi:6-pyruvoyltetrahydropterin/6-carboxytetrahydropterin synthase
MSYISTKIIELGSCAFRQPNAAFDRQGAGINSKRCSFVHGYKLQAKFWFECSHLDEKNWSVDFGGLGNLKLMLQHQFDHTLTVDKSDPLLPLFEELHEQGGCDLRVMDGVGIEKVSEWCFKVANQHIQEITNKRCWVSKVEVWEHDANSAIYTE